MKKRKSDLSYIWMCGSVFAEWAVGHSFIKLVRSNRFTYTLFEFLCIIFYKIACFCFHSFLCVCVYLTFM